MIEHLHAIRTRPVWQRAPDDLLARREAPLPKAGRGIAEVIEEFDELPKPMPQGSATRIHGVGAWRRNPAGMVADMLPAGLAVNCGGRSHSGIEIEKQITRWMKEAFGFPHRAPGLLVTGTSKANFLGPIVARNGALGRDVRVKGLASRHSFVPTPPVVSMAASRARCTQASVRISCVSYPAAIRVRCVSIS